jgi:hypothetical protein
VAENWVRCRRCYEVFDAEEGPCPKCGVPYRPPAANLQPIDGLYTERYADKVECAGEAGGAEIPGAKIVDTPRPRRRSRPALFVGAGAVLIVGALVVVIVMELGGGATPTRAPVYVRGAETVQPRQPTLPPILALTLGQVANYQLDAHVTIQANIQLNSQVKWKTQSLTTKFDGHVSEGDQSGTVQTGGTSQEIRMVGGLFFVRSLPSGKWSLLPNLPSYLLVCPVLGVSSTQDLVEIGPTMRAGQMMNHLQSTSSWAPDISRITMTDLSSLPIKPTAMLLDLWVDDNGVPLSATVEATNIGDGGTKLLDIQITYTFSDVGVPTDMVAPISPSPAPSPSATPGS